MNQTPLTPPEFWQWLDNAPARQGWDDQQLAENAGLPGTALSHARNGLGPLDAAACRALAHALDTDANAVLQLAGHGASAPPTATSAVDQLMATFRAMNDQDRRALLELAVVLFFRRTRKP